MLIYVLCLVSVPVVDIAHSQLSIEQDELTFSYDNAQEVPCQIYRASAISSDLRKPTMGAIFKSKGISPFW